MGFDRKVALVFGIGRSTAFGFAARATRVDVTETAFVADGGLTAPTGMPLRPPL